MLLTDLDIAQCAECGKLFQLEPGRKLCRECSGEAARPMAEPKPLAPVFFPGSRGAGDPTRTETLRGVGELPPVTAKRPQIRQCVRCNARRTLGDSDFCLHCHVDLHHSLGDAANDLLTSFEFLDERALGPSAVLAAYEEKRARTATSRINPSGARRVR
jgi:hypothetical protein